MASDHAPGKTARQLAQQQIAFAVENLVELAKRSERGAGDRVRATLALLELAGVMSPDAAAEASESGGKGVRLVDADMIRRFHERAAGGGDGR